MLCVVLAVVTLMVIPVHRRIMRKLYDLNSVDPNPFLEFFNSRPVAPDAFRVLFIGDSLTFHTPLPHVWDYFSGMAATSADKDFVHLSSTYMQTKVSRPVEVFYDISRDGKMGTMLAYYRSHPELKPDLIVVQGGEHDTLDENYRSTYEQPFEPMPQGDRPRRLVVG